MQTCLCSQFYCDSETLISDQISDSRSHGCHIKNSCFFSVFPLYTIESDSLLIYLFLGTLCMKITLVCKLSQAESFAIFANFCPFQESKFLKGQLAKVYAHEKFFKKLIWWFSSEKPLYTWLLKLKISMSLPHKQTNRGKTLIITYNLLHIITMGIDL